MPHDLDPTPAAAPLGLFEGVGIELEYMLVHRQTLDVLPLSDALLIAEAGQITGDIAFEDVTWSNELVLHVAEIKTTRPVAALAGVAETFHQHVRRIARRLEPLDGCLLPTAMHPWMDPFAQAKLWPHDSAEIYAAFDRIFDARGHGWANLQSQHLNLPFKDDAEFGRLHAAVRLLLPILPALAASSPIMDGKRTGRMDNRLHVYRNNCARIPSVTGRVIPERVFTIEDYHQRILNRIYADLAPHDPQRILREEWANARGAIARFVRNTIEIRVLDVQECPAADLAIAALCIAVLRQLAAERWASLADQQAWEVEPLAAILDRTIIDADQAVIDDPRYLAMFGYKRASSCTAIDLWHHLAGDTPGALNFCQREIEMLLTRGCLARRISQALNDKPTHEELHRVYRRLADCLLGNEMFG